MQCLENLIIFEFDFLSDQQEAEETGSSVGTRKEINDNVISSGVGIDTHAIMSTKKIDYR